MSNQYEQKDNSGALFKNENKGANSNHPDYRGNAKIGGQEWALSAWIKESKTGKKYMSLAFSPPFEKQARAAPSAARASAPSGAVTDDVPF